MQLFTLAGERRNRPGRAPANRAGATSTPLAGSPPGQGRSARHQGRVHQEVVGGRTNRCACRSSRPIHYADGRYEPYLGKIVDHRARSTATGPGDTPSRRRDLRLPPGRRGVGRSRPAPGRILSTLARRAYRRPVTDADVQPLLPLLSRRPGANGGFDAGIERALERILRQPEVPVPRRARSGGRRAPRTSYRISDLELASRLSFFLWSSIPDDELLDLASAGQAEGSRRARAAGAAHAGRPPVARRSSPTSPGSGCTCATCRASRPDPRRVPRLRRQPAPGDAAGDGAVLREHHARGPQRRSIC